MADLTVVALVRYWAELKDFWRADLWDDDSADVTVETSDVLEVDQKAETSVCEMVERWGFVMAADWVEETDVRMVALWEMMMVDSKA